MSTTYEGGAAYWGRVVRQAMGTSSGGHPQFVLTFTVVGKVNPSDPDGELLSCEENERSLYRVITDKTVDYVWQDIETLCEAKGLQAPASMRNLDPTRADFTHDFTDAELAFYCKHEPYEGKLREKWQISRPAGTNAGDPLDDKGMRQLDALFGKRLSTAKAADKVPAKRSRDTKAAMNLQAPPADDGPAPWDENEAPAAAGNDDIPF